MNIALGRNVITLDQSVKWGKRKSHNMEFSIKFRKTLLSWKNPSIIKDVCVGGGGGGVMETGFLNK